MQLEQGYDASWTGFETAVGDETAPFNTLHEDWLRFTESKHKMLPTFSVEAARSDVAVVLGRLEKMLGESKARLDRVQQSAYGSQQCFKLLVKTKKFTDEATFLRGARLMELMDVRFKALEDNVESVIQLEGKIAFWRHLPWLSS